MKEVTSESFIGAKAIDFIQQWEAISVANGVPEKARILIMDFTDIKFCCVGTTCYNSIANAMAKFEVRLDFLVNFEITDLANKHDPEIYIPFVVISPFTGITIDLLRIQC